MPDLPTLDAHAHIDGKCPPEAHRCSAFALMDGERLAWRNLATIVRRTGTLQLLPKAIAAILVQSDEPDPMAASGRPAFGASPPSGATVMRSRSRR